MNSKSQFQICRLGTQLVVSFAADELARYLSKMTKKRVTAIYSKVFSPETKVLYVGGVKDFADLGVALPCEVSTCDDTLILKTIGKALILSGSNPRSALFAVYRYLEISGARWLWPGDEGEFLPRLNTVGTLGFNLTEKASLKHRGVCVEGATSLEHNLEFIDWMAKKRLNEYHLHFDTLYVNYNSYYSREHGPGVPPTTAVSLEESHCLDAQVVEEVKRRGLVLERGGHNWTCGALGIEGFGLEADAESLSAEKKRMLALVDGKRDLFKGDPNNTQLCYSNAQAFTLLVNHVVQYALEHPEVDILHFWLADNAGNLCECSACRKLTPSDWYVRLVNAISGKMAASGCRNKLVFLSYMNTRWAPTEEKIDNRHGNVVFMLAPYPACYIHALTDSQCQESYPLERPKRNKESQPRTNRVYRGFLTAWQQYFEADSFLFYYHLWASDILTCDLEAIIWQDVRQVKDLGLNGILSAQPLSVFWPTGSAVSVLAETAWNTEIELKAITDDYLQAAFADEAGFVRDYLGKLYSCMAPKDPYAHDDIPKDLGQIESALQHVENALPYLKTMSSSWRTNPTEKAVTYLVLHNRYTAYLLRALLEYVNGNKSQSVKNVTRAAEFLTKSENELFWALDLDVTRHRLEGLKLKYGDET